MCSVGETSGLDFPVARVTGPRDAKCLKQDLQDSHDLQDYLPCNEHAFCHGCLFRSFRTLGTARDRPSPYGSRRGILGDVARGPVPRDAKCLKQDLQDSHDLQDYLPCNEHAFCHGCLFRSFRTLGTARDRPSPYGSRRGVLGDIARGPVPRDAKCLKQDSQDLQDYLPLR